MSADNESRFFRRVTAQTGADDDGIEWPLLSCGHRPPAPELFSVGSRIRPAINSVYYCEACAAAAREAIP